MATERIIICCVSSLWTRIVAWVQIIGIMLLLPQTAVEFSYATTEPIETKLSSMGILVFRAIALLIGILMAVILLIGSYRRYVPYIQSWLIYLLIAASVALVYVVQISVVSSVWMAGLGILELVIDTFSFVVVLIHMKEIDDGVTILPI